jgi:hypothetical protein
MNGRPLPVVVSPCISLPLRQPHTPTEDLQQQAGIFRKNARDLKSKMWWKDMRVRPCPASCCVYTVRDELWSAVHCAEAECGCCVVNVVGCWTQLFTVVCLDASTALAAVYTVLSVLAGMRYLCSKLFARALTRYMHLLQRINRLRYLRALC